MVFKHRTYKPTHSGQSRFNRSRRAKVVVLAIFAAFGCSLIAPAALGQVRTSQDATPAWRTLIYRPWLAAVAMTADSRDIFIAGRSGAILKRANGEKTWSTVRDGGTDIKAIAVSRDGARVIAVGVEGDIHVGTDGGAAWTSLTRGVSDFLDVAMSDDGKVAIAVAEDGKVFVSADYGRQWTRRQLNGRGLAGAALSADGMHAVVVGTNFAAVSDDRGKTWRHRNWPFRKVSDELALRDVAMSADGRRVVAVGLGGVIQVSEDGGRNWVKRRSEGPWFSRVAVSADGSRAVAVGNDGEVVWSDDGGRQWRSQNVAKLMVDGKTKAGSDLNGVAMSSNGHGVIAVGENGPIVVSADGGVNWSAYRRKSPNLHAVAFVGETRRGVVVGDYGMIYMSRDNGKTWSVKSKGGAILWGVDASRDGQTIFAAGSFGSFAYSVDGGETWKKKAFSAGVTVEDVAVSADGKLIVTVGKDGWVVSSKDGGKSWIDWSSDRERFLSVAISDDGATIAAAGAIRTAGGANKRKGVIRISVNGGKSWREVRRGNGFYAVAVSGDGRALVAGENEMIHLSRDGGNSWETHAVVGVRIRDIAVSADGKVAVAVGLDGGIAMTEDGGRTWSPTQHGGSMLEGVAITRDGRLAVAVGEYSRIIARVR